MPQPEDDQPLVMPLPPEAEAEIATLARRARDAAGPVMKAVAFAGTRVETALGALPDGVRDAVERATFSALELAYAGAAATSRSEAAPDMGARGHVIATVLTGAAGGFAGVASSIVELPVTVGIMFAAIQKAARAEGFDPDDDEIRRHCLLVFGAGNPDDPEDDGVDTSFVASRLLVTGVTVHGLIASVAPRLAAALSQKLASQMVPLLGSAAGAAINYAFTSYYQELASIRFALLRLTRSHGEDAVRLSFNSAGAELKRLRRA